MGKKNISKLRDELNTVRNVIGYMFQLLNGESVDLAHTIFLPPKNEAQRAQYMTLLSKCLLEEEALVEKIASKKENN